MRRLGRWLAILTMGVAGLVVVAVGIKLLVWAPWVKPFLPGLKIDFPPGYSLTREEGEDFDVYHLKPTTEAGKGAGSMGVYVGWFANSFRPGGGCFEGEGLLCGKQVKWYSWNPRRDGQRSCAREAYAKMSGWLGGVTVHAFIFSDNAEGAEAFQAIAARMKVVREREESIPFPLDHQSATKPAATMGGSG